MKPTRIFDLLDRYILKFPDKKDALSAKIDGEWINYSARQYHDISHHFAYGLIKMGFRKGDKIITITNNRPEWNFVDMGMSMIGIIHVPVFTSLTCDEYRYVFEHSDSKMVMISDKRLLRNIKPVCDEVKQIKHVYTFNKIEDAHNWLEIVKAGEEAGNDIIELTESIKSGINEDDFASLIYTSGTTGRQKGVMLSHKNMVRNFLAATDVFKLGINDRYLSILPLCHVGGRMGNYQTQFSGASIYYAESMGALASTLKEIKAKGFDAVPRVIEKIYDNVIAKGRSLKGIKKRMFFWAVKLGLEYKPFGQKSWFYYRKLKIADKLIFSKWRDALGGKARIIGCGGASLQPRHERIFWAAGIKILNMYGLTETSPIITINRQEDPMCRLGSVGKLIDGVEVKIDDDGEVLCRGHNVMLGYYKDTDLTEKSIDSEGWFHTGDIGYMDDNFLMITDRKKDIFKLSNGKFIAPQVIENIMKASPFIDQVMVTGEHQKFASALIVPNFSYLKNWCVSENIYDEQDNTELICMPSVREMFNNEVKKINGSLSDSEKILRLRLVPDEWSPLSGELSASMKLKRQVINEKYRDFIDRIYSRS